MRKKLHTAAKYFLCISLVLFAFSFITTPLESAFATMGTSSLHALGTMVTQLLNTLGTITIFGFLPALITLICTADSKTASSHRSHTILKRVAQLGIALLALVIIGPIIACSGRAMTGMCSEGNILTLIMTVGSLSFLMTVIGGIGMLVTGSEESAPSLQESQPAPTKVTPQ